MLMMTASLLLKMVEPGGATELLVAVEAEMVSGGARRGASSWRGCRGCPSLHCRSKIPEECDASFNLLFLHTAQVINNPEESSKGGGVEQGLSWGSTSFHG